MTKNAYTAEDRAAVMEQVSTERAALDQAIRADLEAIEARIAEAEAANLYIGACRSISSWCAARSTRTA